MNNQYSKIPIRAQGVWFSVESAKVKQVDLTRLDI